MKLSKKKEKDYLVIVNIKVVRGTEDGYEGWEARRLRLTVHAIPGVLRLVRPYYAEEIVVLQKIAARCVTVTKKNKKIFKLHSQ